MNFQEIREKSWSGGNGSAIRAVKPQLKIKLFTAPITREANQELLVLSWYNQLSINALITIIVVKS